MYSELVSVIIPAYNAEQHILQCVNSVLEQTYSNLEIIIVNDGSKDNTFSILKSIQDPRIILINQGNLGCSSAKNAGLEHVKGSYVQYLDADDILSLDKIECQMLEIQSFKDVIAVCKTVVFSNNIREPIGEIDTDLIRKEGSGISFLLRLLGSDGCSGMVQPNAYLLPKEIVDKIGNWNIDISPSPDEDGEYFARALLASNRVCYTKGINYYRKLPDQKSLSQVHTYKRALNLLRSVDLKFKHIFTIQRSRQTDKLFQLNTSQVAYQYGVDYPEIIKECRKTLHGNTFTSLKILKPWKFRIISFFIGFKNTIWLKRLLK